MTALEETVGARALPGLLKSIDALDGHCERLLAPALAREHEDSLY